jgi:hypothetical protein
MWVEELDWDVQTRAPVALRVGGSFIHIRLHSAAIHKPFLYHLLQHLTRVNSALLFADRPRARIHVKGGQRRGGGAHRHHILLIIVVCPPERGAEKKKRKEKKEQLIELISKKKSQSNRDKGSAWERVGTKEKTKTPVNYSKGNEIDTHGRKRWLLFLTSCSPPSRTHPPGSTHRSKRSTLLERNRGCLMYPCGYLRGIARRLGG